MRFCEIPFFLFLLHVLLCFKQRLCDCYFMNENFLMNRLTYLLTPITPNGALATDQYSLAHSVLDLAF